MRIDEGRHDSRLRVITGRNVATLLTTVLTMMCICVTPALATGSSKGTIHVAPHPRPAVSSVRPDAGPVSGGQSITVSGTGFVKGASVEIGQGKGAGPTAIVARDIVVVSGTEITATTGGKARAGTWNLFVISSGETSRSSSDDHYRYDKSS
jgi:IPT/TIG domain